MANERAMYLLIEKSMINDGFQIWRGDIDFSPLRDGIRMPAVFCYLPFTRHRQYRSQLFNFEIFSVLLWPAVNIFAFDIKRSSSKMTLLF